MADHRSSFTRWNNQKMLPVIRMFRDYAPYLIPVCQILTTHLYDPMMNNQPLRLGMVRGGADEALMTKLLASEKGEGRIEEVEAMDTD
jgi:hypothetical protein